jgi:hypothetical protein
MNTGNLLSESDWELMINPPDTDQNAWNFGTNLIDEFFAPNAPFWAETNNNGELIASDFQFNGQAGSGIDTAGGSDSVMQQIDHDIDFLPTRSSSEVLDAMVSTNKQSSPPAFPDPALMSPSVVVSDTELPAAEKAEIGKMTNSLPPLVFSGEHDSNVAMKDSSPPLFVSATTPLVVGREGAQTLPYGTDGTAGRTPHSAQQLLPQLPMTPSNAPAQTLGATPNMAATAAHYSSSPYHRGRHTQSTGGAESLRCDMEQPNLLPATTAAIPFPGLKIQEATSPAQETTEDDESTVTLARLPKKRAHTRKPKLKAETNKCSVQETAEDGESAVTLAKVPKKRASTRTSGPTTEATASSAQETAKENEPANTPLKGAKTRKPKAAIENQMFAVVTTSDNGTQNEKLAKGSELSFKSPAPKRKAQPEPMHQELEASKKARTKHGCSSREVRLLTGVEVKEDNKRRTRASVKAGGETDAGPDAGKAVRQRRQAKK